ncbi:hypothetical protein [Aeromonas veronii]|uniref:hypothetical protein n=1 Tax=Aeromonas veronii TaxID=654 RepID=UPI0018809CEF|nr:hypothetical protein [Aeromonas veronii]MBE8733889.1 hypothetical protein [Aeromonas veronii]MBE8738280.1 hypothetical protein [Aeromonas veronii]MBE8741875.1 hypothetical protein [Aeromonas veronii]MBE8763225.1 hypothetical protein [Aeromonas veronii]MBE8837837.1 hypothetical protein [Aeromonas veronii]
MINFLGSVALDTFYLTRVDFTTSGKENTGSGNVSFENKITILTPNDIPDDEVEYIKLIIDIDVDGKDDANEMLFKFSSGYEAYFKVLNNKAFFEASLKTRSHYCFSLMYPYVMDDLLPLLKRAGVEGVELPLSAALEDMTAA